MKTIYLAGGCFWGVQKFFDQFEGVLHTEAGYANGPENTGTGRQNLYMAMESLPDSGEENADSTNEKMQVPSYEEVCRGSGHAETVRIDFDEEKLSLTDLLEYYFMIIDPVSYNRQGADEGIQYRTGIYYEDESLLPEVQAFYDRKEAEEMARSYEPLAVELEPLRNFYPAEEYHQKYLDKNPRGYCHIPRRMMNLNTSLEN